MNKSDTVDRLRLLNETISNALHSARASDELASS